MVDTKRLDELQDLLDLIYDINVDGSLEILERALTTLAIKSGKIAQEIR